MKRIYKYILAVILTVFVGAILLRYANAAQEGGAGHQGNILAPTVTIEDSSTTPPLNLTERSSAPSSPASGDMYLDSGSNCADTSKPCLRHYTGAAWEEISPGGSGGGDSRWSTWTGASRTDDDTISSTTHLAIGTPIRFRATAGTYRYAIVTALSTNAHDFDGHPCTTSDDDEFEYGQPELVRVYNIITPGNCTVDDPFSLEGYWQGAPAFMVRTTARADTAPTGAALTLNSEINDADAHSSEVSITAGSTAEFDSGTNITVANYDIAFGEKFHISTSQCGSTVPGGNPLTVTLTFIIP